MTGSMTASRSSRRWALAVIVIVLAGAGALVHTVRAYSARTSAAATSSTGVADLATTPVTRQTLTESVTIDGEVSYGDAHPLDVKLSGTLTWLPTVGTVISRGDSVARVDDAPVVLLYGSLPMYRPLAQDTTGRDVRQLEDELHALGYRGFAVDDRFTAATTAAVKRWQHDLGVEETGTVDVGRVVYADGPVRVATTQALPGASTPAQVVSVTGTIPAVRASLASPASWATPGTRVSLRAAGGRTTDATITAVTTGGGVGGTAGAGGTGTGAAAGTGATPGETLQITPDDPTFIGAAGQPSVTVTHIEQEHAGVLTVPVAALLALAEGGYGVEVVDGATSRTVAVQTGMFAGGRVEVGAPGLTEGQLVGLAR